MSYVQIGDDAVKEALRQQKAGLPKPDLATIRKQMKEGTYVSPVLPSTPSPSESAAGGPPVALIAGVLAGVGVLGYSVWKKRKSHSSAS